MFRHVRLTRNFRNMERLSDGRVKLRIPTQLLLEKKRTATRFTVARRGRAYLHFGADSVVQVMRSKAADAEEPSRAKGPRPPCGGASLAKRMRLDRKPEVAEAIDLGDIIHGVLGPVAFRVGPSRTVFTLSEEESAEHIVQHLFKECPTITADREGKHLNPKPLCAMGSMYDRNSASNGGS
eukprot:79012-Hanusia_phi.AAC.1